MMRLWYAKYALTLLASTAITFHLLYSGTRVVKEVGEDDTDPRGYYGSFIQSGKIGEDGPPVQHTGYAFTKSDTGITDLPHDNAQLKVPLGEEDSAVLTDPLQDMAPPRTFTRNQLGEGGTGVTPPEPRKGYAFTKSSSYLRRKLSRAPGWVVLPGNVTVHEGEETTPFPVSFHMNASSLCGDLDVSRKSLLIFVASSAEHSERRAAIRETWGLRLLQRAHNYRIAFLVGRSTDDGQEAELVRESYRHGDLVQINATETFRNLGLKSVAGLKWSLDFCGRADFVMKMDDDILLHVPNLLSALEGASRDDPLLACHENRMRRILRSALMDLPSGYHKYEVSERELPGVFYPPYCSGMAYAFSASVRDRLLSACAATPVFFIEDVHVTGFCRHKARVGIRPLAGVALRPPVQQPACAFRDGRLTSQEVGAAEMRDMWREINTQGFFCPTLLGLRRL